MLRIALMIINKDSDTVCHLHHPRGYEVLEEKANGTVRNCLIPEGIESRGASVILKIH